MRNVNLNILKFLHSINKFYLSLSNIGLEVSSRSSGDSILRVRRLFYLFFPHPTPSFKSVFSESGDSIQEIGDRF
ncbi:MAG: hypothetical protein EHM73_04750 [Chroococcales cyanobacterium metabat2.561]|uniref:Uncharacterized protein n=1 Tax=Microcystis aeruginosa Ma_SC_T_19800800_S464 TaxID=2486257 RepID=A0A552E1N4_MICAE|nr:MAG: hypothetical protein EHM73_04750 [Chroococcales cyanobacterium metabat2.561]TRU28344.1 MAG: hypothetical protein EWV81_05345 [Microcystis aeruginosa Ma_SC_T_19800800_S464]